MKKQIVKFLKRVIRFIENEQYNKELWAAISSYEYLMYDEHIKNLMPFAPIAYIKQFKQNGKYVVYLYTTRPGLLIGKGGRCFKHFEEYINRICPFEVDVQIVELCPVPTPKGIREGINSKTRIF